MINDSLIASKDFLPGRIIMINYWYLLIRLILCVFKLKYSFIETFIEIFACTVLYYALKWKNPYLCTYYTTFSLFEILYSWVDLLVKAQNTGYFRKFTFDNVYYLIVCNMSVVFYIISAYFLFCAYKELKIFEGIEIGKSNPERKEIKYFEKVQNESSKDKSKMTIGLLMELEKKNPTILPISNT